MNIGDLWMRVVADDKGFEADLVKKTGKAADTAGQGMVARIKKSFSGAALGQGLIQGLGLAGGLGAANLLSSAIGNVVGAIGGFVRAAQEEQVGIQRLGASLKANIPNWDGNTDAIEKLIAKREDLAFSDDDLRASLALLVGATHDVTEAQNIQATAMDLARFKNISLQEASEALTKVEAGSYRVLKSLGIVLKDGATQTEALAAVQKVAAGQAEAYGKTTAGAFERAQIKIQDAQEEIGKQLLPILADLANVLVDDIIPAAQDFIGTLQDVIAPVAKVNELLKDQGGIIGIVGKAWEFVTKPLKDAGDAFFEIGYQIESAAGKTHSAEDEMRHAALSIGMSVDDLKTKFAAAQGAVVAWSHEGEGGARAMSRSFATATGTMAAGVKTLASETDDATAKVKKDFDDMVSALIGDANSLLDDVFDPVIERDRLAANQAEESAARRVLASAKATAAEKRDARETLHQVAKDQAELYLKLLESGDITSKEYKALLSSLQAKSKASTGQAKKDIDALIAKAKELYKVLVSGPQVSITIHPVGTGPSAGKQHGGRVRAGVPTLVGELRPEVFVPDTNGRILPSVASAAAAGISAGGSASNITIYNPVPHAADEDIGRMMRRLEALGMAR